MLSAQQKNTLAKILLIEDIDRTTLSNVLQRMEALSLFLKENHYTNFLPFHHVYHALTEKMAATYEQQPHYFLNRKEAEQLDVVFASLYFEPLYTYLTENKLTLPWQTFFTYCELPYGTPIVQMLLGMNAHFNANLVTAMKKITYKQEKDFFRINDLFLFEIPRVMKYVAFADHDFFAMSGMIFLKTFLVEEFPHVIIKWREDAWRHYQANISQHTLALQTESLAKKIMHTFDHMIPSAGIKGVTQQIDSLQLPAIPL